MSIEDNDREAPDFESFEALFVNNEPLDKIGAYINRFNPINVMKMQRMEIRHSAILAWLLTPNETHGLGDQFLTAFLAKALSGTGRLPQPNALDIVHADLSDAEIKTEWKNIDIFIHSYSQNWAFIIENKFGSTQRKNQLSDYRQAVEEAFKDETSIAIRGIYLTLSGEEPNDPSYAVIDYESVCEIIKLLLSKNENQLSSEVVKFIEHYLEVIEDETGMSEEQVKMEELAKQLYREHKKVLDFVMEHGASNDFSIAVDELFGEKPHENWDVTIGNRRLMYSNSDSRGVSFLPYSWYETFGDDLEWAGCEKWWAGYPLIVWFQIRENNDGKSGKLWLFAEVGPLTDKAFRKDLLEAILSKGNQAGLKRIATRGKNINSDGKYTKVFKENSKDIKDVFSSDEIANKMKDMLKDFSKEFDAIAEILPQFLEHGYKSK